ncbi:hypothetical protein KAH94_02540 [bacterium]|nr:hypothetical protein [bacterium]
MKTIENLKAKVNSAITANQDGRQVIVNSCKELYNIIEEGFYNKYGQESVTDAYNDLCNGNFAEPFMCEQKKSKFLLYANIYLSKIA